MEREKTEEEGGREREKIEEDKGGREREKIEEDSWREREKMKG